MLEFLKREKILCIAWLLALGSAFWVHPDKEYLKYVDLKVLALLFALMVLVKGFQEIGIFDLLISNVFKHIQRSRKLVRILVLLCFFLSMVITNDVALLTFVPFAIQTLRICNQEKLMIKVIVLQTIAANLGSMFTPIGNSQNLYLFSVSGMKLGEFLGTMFPLTLLSLVFLVGMTGFMPDEEMQVDIKERNKKVEKKEFTIYSLLFVLNLLVVFRILEWLPALLITIILLIGMKKYQLFRQVDYALLLTFVGFFVFVGNAGRISWLHEAIGSMMQGREVLMATIFSQFLSNVPAALLLSGFTDHYEALLIGTNIGGLGTIIASMASLISYKLYSQTEHSDKSAYLSVFTGYNILGLVILLTYVIIM